MAMRLAGEIAEALQEAHARRFLHRDLKPANIMLTDQGHVKVMDFGLAKRVEDLPSPDQATRQLVAAQLTAHGSIVGTPDYMRRCRTIPEARHHQESGLSCPS